MEAQLMKTKTHYSLESLNEIACGDQDFMKKLVEIFLNNTPADCAVMVNASNAGDWKETGRMAHKLKSTINALNIFSIKDLIRDIELNAKNEVKLEDIPKSVHFVEKIILETADQLKADFNIN